MALEAVYIDSSKVRVRLSQAVRTARKKLAVWYQGVFLSKLAVSLYTAVLYVGDFVDVFKDGKWF